MQEVGEHSCINVLKYIKFSLRDISFEAIDKNRHDPQAGIESTIFWRHFCAPFENLLAHMARSLSVPLLLAAFQIQEPGQQLLQFIHLIDKMIFYEIYGNHGPVSYVFPNTR
jgi:hypothetical protein